MNSRRLEMPWRKRVRANVIKTYCLSAGYRGVVCFSCGNASLALQDAGVFTVAVAPRAMALSMAFPEALYIPEYDDANPATTYDARAPLNRLVLSVSRGRRAHLHRGVEIIYEGKVE